MECSPDCYVVRIHTLNVSISCENICRLSSSSSCKDLIKTKHFYQIIIYNRKLFLVILLCAILHPNHYCKYTKLWSEFWRAIVFSATGYSILFMTVHDLIMLLNLLNYTRCVILCVRRCDQMRNVALTHRNFNPSSSHVLSKSPKAHPICGCMWKINVLSCRTDNARLLFIVSRYSPLLQTWILIRVRETQS